MALYARFRAKYNCCPTAVEILAKNRKTMTLQTRTA